VTLESFAHPRHHALGVKLDPLGIAEVWSGGIACAEMQPDASLTSTRFDGAQPRRPNLARLIRSGRVKLPVAAEPGMGDGSTTTPSEDTAAARTSHQGHETILVAEDEAYVRDMIVVALERIGYRVVAASTGEEAVRLIDRMGEEIDLLLSDVVMPGMSGPDLYDRARRTRPDLRAVFMSGYSALAMRRPIPAGITLLEKPFSSARLNEVVRQALDAR
jgi:CheY-like chemotaxis protein